MISSPETTAHLIEQLVETLLTKQPTVLLDAKNRRPVLRSLACPAVLNRRWGVIIDVIPHRYRVHVKLQQIFGNHLG